MKTIRFALCFALTCGIASVTTAQGGLADLLESGVEGPVVVVDLVKFKPDGAARYAIYDEIAEAKVKDLGGEVIFRGVAKEVSGFDSDAWDRVTFRKYPSMQAVMAMASSTEYQGAFPNRLASVAKSFVYAFSGELPSFVEGAKPRMHPMNAVSAPQSDDTVYMLNMLRFKPEGGERKFFLEYGAPREGHRPDPVLMLKGLGPVIADEAVDRLILVRYPSVEVFTAMVASPEYQAVSHLRTEAIELGLIWAFTKVEK